MSHVAGGGYVLVALGFVLVALMIPGCARALLARATRMRVPRLMLGFGPLLATVRLGGTRLELHALPLGAFSQVAGLSAVDEPVAGDAPDSFANRPAPARLLVLFAGAIGYFAGAVVIAVATSLTAGVLTEGKTPTISAVIDGKPAAQAGLAVDDEILAIDDEAISDTSQVAPAINRSRAPVRLLIRRDQRTLTLTVVPVADLGGRRIGIELRGAVRFEHVAPARALGEGALLPLRYARFIIRGLVEDVRGQQRSVVTGPIGMVKATGREVSRGPRVAALMCVEWLVYLALFMLMPVVPYDGGRALARLLRRRPQGALPPARDLGTVAFSAPPFAPIDIAMLVLFALATLLLVLNVVVPLVMAVTFVGLLRRRALAWSIAAATTPALAFASLVTAHVGVLGTRGGWVRIAGLALTALWLTLALWLRSAGVRARFGLACPSCRELQARAVPGSRGALSCLSCGSSWRR